MPQKKQAAGRRNSSGQWDLPRLGIADSGVYRNPEGLEGKYFYPTRAQAENLGSQYAKMGLGEQTLTSGRISTELLNQFGEPIEPAGEGPAYFLRNDLLPYILGVTTEGPLP